MLPGTGNADDGDDFSVGTTIRTTDRWGNRSGNGSRGDTNAKRFIRSNDGCCSDAKLFVWAVTISESDVRWGESVATSTIQPDGFLPVDIRSTTTGCAYYAEWKVCDTRLKKRKVDSGIGFRAIRPRRCITGSSGHRRRR